MHELQYNQDDEVMDRVVQVLMKILQDKEFSFLLSSYR